MDNCILFISYTDFNDLTSGSRVRPYRMYEAFREKGYDVLLISGDLQSRKDSFKKAGDKIGRCKFCYIEPSTYPVHPYDYIIYTAVYRRKVPIGVFYRDAYYRFPEWWGKSGYKKYELLLRYKADWTLFRSLAKAIFFPTETMAGYFNFDTRVPLPPGAEEKFINRKKETVDTAVYVGGMSERYGGKLLLESFREINRSRKLALNLVCRRDERVFTEGYEDDPWLNIYHVSGRELDEVYEKSDFAVIPILKNDYNDFAMPVKLFEYLSYGLPVVSTDCLEMARFINDNGVGIVAGDNTERFAAALEKMSGDTVLYESLRRNVTDAVNKNLWIHRVETIENTLLGKDGVSAGG